ncbi:hypothetical protein [Dyadobacter crusticola]|uniref:hypothetical protein n=1 Tax=Dyadobacter crusticola TaxID=292407 RepID=UPI0004E27FF5|nr:hypothetical protein [Dyadobacter crusticola]
MELSELEVPKFGILHSKTDKFKRVFEIEKEDGTPFTPEGLELVWEIYDKGVVVLVLEGNDFIVEGNEVVAEKSPNFFANLSKLSDYTHRFYDRATENTFFEGPFKLT